MSGVEERLYRITAEDFCAGAVFACDPPICIDAADRVQSLIGHGLDKCLAFCRLQGWEVEFVSNTQMISAKSGGDDGRSR